MPVPIVSIAACAGSAGGPRPVLGEHRHVGVVVDEHRQSQRARSSPRRKSMFGQRQVDRHHGSRARVDQAGDAEAHGADLGMRHIAANLRDRLQHRVENLALVVCWGRPGGR